MAFVALATTASAQQVTSLDQLDNTKVYTITAGGGRGSFYFNGTSQFVRSTGKDNVTLNPAERNHQFAICQENGKYYLISIGADKYVTGDGKSNNGGAPLVLEAATVTLQSGRGVENSWVFTTTSSNHQLAISNSYTNGVINTWDDVNDVGNCMTINAVEGQSFDFAAFKVRIQQAILQQKKTNALALADGFKQFNADAYTTVASAINSATAETQINEALATYYSAVNNVFAQKYYRLQNVRSSKYIGIKADNTNLTWCGDVLDENNKQLVWQLACVDGKVTFKNFTNKKYIGAIAAGSTSTTAFSTNPYPYSIAQKEVINGNNSFEFVDNGKPMQAENSGYLNWWYNGTDNNARWYISEVTVTEAEIVAALGQAYDEQKAINDALIAENEGVADQFDKLTAYSLHALKASIPATKPTTSTDLQNAIDAMRAAVAAAKYNFDGFLTFVTTQSGGTRYLGVNPGGSKFVGQTAFTGAQNLWKVTAHENGYAIQNVATGKYVTVPVTSVANATSTTPVALTLYRADGKISFGGSGAFTLMHLAGNMELVGWEIAGAATRWTVTPIEGLTVNVTAELSNYATFSAPFATQIPEGVTAYTGVANGTSIRLTAIEGGIIPANTGVLVKAATAGEYQFKLAASAGSIAGTNAFVASLWDKTKTETNVYTLQNNEGVGFYPYSGANLLGFKAYVNIPAASPVQGLSLDFGQVTAIESAAVENGKFEIFDLQGRRVKNAKSGLYIVNGKKMILQ